MNFFIAPPIYNPRRRLGWLICNGTTTNFLFRPFQLAG